MLNQKSYDEKNKLGKTNFMWFYPLRIKKYNSCTAINYLGVFANLLYSFRKKNKVYVFQFLKNSIIKRFGGIV